MKIALFALGLFAFAQGIHLEDGSSMEVEFDFNDRTGCCIAPSCDHGPPRNFCHGFVAIRTEFNGDETFHGKIVKFEGEDAPQSASKMRYKGGVPGGRAANKILEVQGNCCWTFYQR